MLEVEVKVRADHADVRPRLDAVGAEPLDRLGQVDTYYDAPHRNFAETDEALRLRREADEAGVETALLAYKGPLVDDASKTREESETVVGDGDATAEALESLGFEPAATVRKDRERYAVDDYVVTLDAVGGLGEFVEVEASSAIESGDSERVRAAREGAFDVLRSLGLDPDDQLRTSYLGLLLEGGSGDASE